MFDSFQKEIFMKLKVITALFAALLFAVPAAGAAEVKPHAQVQQTHTVKKNHLAAHGVKKVKKQHPLAAKPKKHASVHQAAKKTAKVSG